MIKLACVIPCYNEALVFHDTLKQCVSSFNKLVSDGLLSSESYFCFVNDGSSDQTWEFILDASRTYSYIRGINLSSNRGHQNALLAGLLTVKNDVDAVLSMDADLQDDLDLIPTMIQEWMKGFDIIYGVRKERVRDSCLKRTTAIFFYKLMYLLGTRVIFNHADFRLCSKRVLDALETYRETNLFLRGIFVDMGFASKLLYYDRLPRLSGESKYSFKKMIAFAWQGVTSFSLVPLRVFTLLGLGILFISLTMIGYIFWGYSLGRVVPGWSSLACLIVFFGGIQMVALGVLGEYLGKVYLEVKARPKYLIESKVGFSSEKIMSPATQGLETLGKN